MSTTASRQLERRKRYQGTCLTCGKPTDGSNGRAKAPRHCRKCFQLTPEWKAKHTYWTATLLLNRIDEWAILYGEPPSGTDWNPTRARYNNDEFRAARFVRASGYWPTCSTVINEFGSWNAAIERAGLIPRAPHGGGGNQFRRRNKKELQS